MTWIPTRIVQSVTRDRDVALEFIYVSVLMSGRNAFPMLEIQLYFADDFFLATIYVMQYYRVDMIVRQVMYLAVVFISVTSFRF